MTKKAYLIDNKYKKYLFDTYFKQIRDRFNVKKEIKDIEEYYFIAVYIFEDEETTEDILINLDLFVELLNKL